MSPSRKLWYCDSDSLETFTNRALLQFMFNIPSCTLFVSKERRTFPVALRSLFVCYYVLSCHVSQWSASSRHSVGHLGLEQGFYVTMLGARGRSGVGRPLARVTGAPPFRTPRHNKSDMCPVERANWIWNRRGEEWLISLVLCGSRLSINEKREQDNGVTDWNKCLVIYPWHACIIHHSVLQTSCSRVDEGKLSVLKKRSQDFQIFLSGFYLLFSASESCSQVDERKLSCSKEMCPGFSDLGFYLSLSWNQWFING